MNKPKQFYEAPEAETLVVRFEGCLCGSPQYGTEGSAGADLEYNSYGEDF